MSRQTFALIRNLSLETLWPNEVSQAMHTYLCFNLKLVRRTLTVNLLGSLLRNNCGTNEVMLHADNITKHFARRKSYDNTVKFIMREKHLDAESDQKHIKGKFLRSKGEYLKLVKKNSPVDTVFNNVMKYEVGKLWNIGKEKNRQKVEFLCNKWSRNKDKEFDEN